MTIVRRLLPDSRHTLIEFCTKNISIGDMFVSSEDLSALQVGKEIEFVIDDRGRRYCEGTATIVRAEAQEGFGVRVASENSAVDDDRGARQRHVDGAAPRPSVATATRRR